MAYYAPFYQPTYYNPTTARQDVPQYNQQYQPMAQTVQAPQNNNGLIWVNGEVGAKSYLVAPGNTVMLMDAENSTFYLKSADASGMPMPLRIFDYKERQNATTSDFKEPTSDFPELDGKYITREEFERRMASVSHTCKCHEKENNLMEVAENG